MIVKELDPFVDTGDMFARAGHQAEKQMAHYLHRAFGENKGVYVLNGLRLERGEDAAQIDHLILHLAGAVIVESKSSHGTLRVNDYGEWTRVFGDRQQGMPSPIEQAKRQGQFLKDFLNDNAPKIGGKLLGIFQTYFGALTVDVVVAISDTGIIERPGKLNLAEVCKADQAATKVKDLVAKHKSAARSFKPNFDMKSGREFTRAELDNVLVLLPASHTPARVHPLPVQAIPITEQLSPLPAVSPTAAGEVCALCHKVLSPGEEQYCRDKADRFSGKFYCFKHQRSVHTR